MPLSVGTRLGAYEITSPLGAGGMGEVYKARDTRLDRTVAIKVLPSHLADNVLLRQRFEQEARAVSSLNHPNICTLHDIGTEDGTDFIVMEYVEGETLADRLERGAVPWEEAVGYARELADALDRAHRAGVVHRDVKPGNVIVTASGIKLLDFGLAKLHGSTESEPDLSAVTEAKQLTEKGAILGTFQYMSPEQLEGKEVDARTDIFALGAVIYEMVTGHKAFKGETQASLIAAIMSGTPRAISETTKLSPKTLDRIVNSCLEKSPDQRWQSAADLKRNLEWLAAVDEDAPMPRPNATSRRLPIALLGAVVGGVAVAIAMLSLATPDRAPIQHLQLDLGGNEGMEPGPSAHVAISPDGTMLAYTAMRDGLNRLYLRRLDDPQAIEVSGSDAAFFPAFSPNGEWIVFQTYPGDRELKKVSIHGGAPQEIHDNRLPFGVAWLEDDTLVFGGWSESQGIYRVASSGGSAELLLEAAGPRSEQTGTVVGFPERLPGTDWILLTRTDRAGPKAAILSLASGEELVLLEDASNAHYVPTGYLVFVRSGDLWAVRFDATRRETVGTERPVVSGVQYKGFSSFSVSDTGLLAYVPGDEGPWIDEGLVWMSRDGEGRAATGERHDYQWPRISPKGDNVALYVEDAAFLENEETIWILDIASGRMNRTTFYAGRNENPVWAPDGRSIIFASDLDSLSSDLYRLSIDPMGEPELVLSSEHTLQPLDVSPDGQTLMFRETGDVYFLSLANGATTPFTATEATESLASFSPDGRFIAYVSNESGREEVYVEPYPPTGAKAQVTREGAAGPVWAADGSEIYYLRDRDRMMMAAQVRFTPSFRVLGEQELFKTSLNRGRNFDVHPTTGELLVIDKTLEFPAQYVNVVTNFFELLEQTFQE